LLLLLLLPLLPALCVTLAYVLSVYNIPTLVKYYIYCEQHQQQQQQWTVETRTVQHSTEAAAATGTFLYST
jgi:hypothetical protein